MSDLGAKQSAMRARVTKRQHPKFDRLGYMRDYYQSHAEEQKQTRKSAYAANRDAELQKAADYRATHKEQISDYDHKRHARRRKRVLAARDGWQKRKLRQAIAEGRSVDLLAA